MKPIHGFGRRSAKRLPEYSAWMDMRSRCNNPKNMAYHLYGGRGITICSRWDDFMNFLIDIGMRPSNKHSLDRIDVNGPYSPENCRWVLREIQDNNKQNTRTITWNGEPLSMAQWERRLGLTKGVLHLRLKMGWLLDRAMTEPVQRSRKRSICKRGHKMIDENIKITSQGRRLCKKCFLEYQHKYNSTRK